MAGTISSRPNHYDTLGLTPAASDDQIAHAFARKMNAFRWHPAGAAAQLWIAFETLRDRIKRADYDRSLGLVPQRTKSWSMAVNQQQWTSFIGSDERETELRASEPHAEPHVRPPEQSEPPLDARLEAIAASIRELTKPAQPDVPAASPPVRDRMHPRRQPDVDLDIVIEDIRKVGRQERERLRLEERPVNWKRPLQLVGGLVVGAGILGVVLGISAQDSAAPADAQSPAPLRHAGTMQQANAPAPPVEPLAAAPFVAVPDMARSHSARPHAYRRSVPSPSARQTDATESSDSAPIQSQPDAATGDQPAADPLAPKPADIKLPLSRSTIARTIDRIGYRCGEVTSAAAVDSSPETFSVTCSSGQTYRATPVHGRYRFRRSSGD